MNKLVATCIQVLPRLIRLRDTPLYLGMDRNRFNTEVRPYLIEIPIGEQGIAFDRLDLDAWVEQYKARSGRPAQPKGDSIWDANAHQDSLNVAVPGTSTRKSADDDFAKALERAYSRKPKNTSRGGSKKSGKRKSMG